MTDKERLEEIKEMLHWADEYHEEGNGRLVDQAAKQMYQEGHIDWLVEQAERVQELEETVNDYRTANKCLHERRIECGRRSKRYKQALEKIREMSKDSVIDRKYFEVVDEALEGEEWV